ncbi:MAG TPA: NGG1p interacting factor NIF3, partial [Candidatus Methanomethylophilaceae archaeon]|nr:NGG1p interacting factor NIF3 [Candidatus Methanomethylophilaceae archaeon]
MKLIDIYHMLIEKGIDADPRGREEVSSELKKQKKEFDEMDEDK